MKTKHILQLFVVLLLASGLAFTGACGDEPGVQENQEDNQNQEPENGDECQDHTDCDGGWICDDGECAPNEEEIEPTPTCEDADPPARCSVEAEDKDDWGPASHIDRLAIADESCCVDFSGDGDPDNSLPDLLSLFDEESGLQDANDGIQASIDDGSLNIVLEHDGLSGLSQEEAFTINFLLGEEVTEAGAIIDPASFEQGTHPHALLPNAVITDGSVEAGPGNVLLSLDLGALMGGDLDLELDLTVSNASVTADVDESVAIEDGVTLENGELGGLILFEEIVKAINDFGSGCDCLGNPDEIVTIDDNEQATCALTGDEDEDSCVDDEELCGELAGYCTVIPVAKNFADIDTTRDGLADAFSVGIEFSASATTILEVGDGSIGDGGNDGDGSNGGDGANDGDGSNGGDDGTGSNDANSGSDGGE